MNKKIILSLTLFSSTVVTVFAAGCKGGEIKDCITGVGGIIDSLNSSVVTALGTLFLAASVVGFLMGVVRFIWAQQQGDEKGVKSGKETLKWGIIALFCAFSIYGIIKFMQNTLLPVQDPSTIVVPRLKIEDRSSQPSQQTTTGGGPTSGGSPTSGGNSEYCVGRSNGDVCQLGSSQYNTTYGKCQNDKCVSLSTSNQSNLNSSQLNSAVQKLGGFFSGNTSSGSVNPQQIYNDCMSRSGNSASECQSAYTAYGGVGAAEQNSNSSTGSEPVIDSGASTGYQDDGGVDFCTKNPDDAMCQSSSN